MYSVRAQSKMSLTLSGGDREHLPKWILFTRVIKEALPAENAGI